MLILLLTLFARLPTLFTDFYNPDETCYATIGQRLLEGKALYVGVIDHKPPLIYYLYALFDLIGSSHGIVVAHAAMILVVAATGLVISSIVKRLGAGSRVAFFAAALYVVGASLGKPNDVMAANAELLFNLPLALYIYFLLRERSFKWLVLSGAFLGVAVLVKPQAAVALLAGVIYFLFYCEGSPARRVANYISLAAGLALPLAVVAVWLYGTGRLAEAWYWGVTINSLYVQGHEGGVALAIRFFKQTGYIVAEQFALWLPLIIAVIWRIRLGVPLVWWWLLASSLAVFPGQRFYGHYYLQMLPPLAILSALAIVGILSRISCKKLAVTVFSVLIAVPFFISWIWAWPIEKNRTKLESVENKRLVEYLKQATGENDRLEVWGRFNGIPYMAGRENGARFLNKNLLAGSFRREELVKMPQRHWQLYFSDLEANRPEWFIDHSPVDMKDAPITDFKELDNYIKANYERYAEIDGNIIYRRNDKSSPRK